MRWAAAQVAQPTSEWADIAIAAAAKAAVPPFRAKSHRWSTLQSMSALGCETRMQPTSTGVRTPPAKHPSRFECEVTLGYSVVACSSLPHAYI